MEYIIALIVALAGGLMYFKRKSERAETDSKIAETKGRDGELKTQQLSLQDAIKEIDAGVERAKAEREIQRQINEHKTLKERAERLKKGLS